MKRDESAPLSHHMSDSDISSQSLSLLPLRNFSTLVFFAFLLSLSLSLSLSLDHTPTHARFPRCSLARASKFRQ